MLAAPTTDDTPACLRGCDPADQANATRSARTEAADDDEHLELEVTHLKDPSPLNRIPIEPELVDLCSFTVLLPGTHWTWWVCLAIYWPFGAVFCALKVLLQLLCILGYLAFAVTLPASMLESLAEVVMWLAANVAGIRVRIRSAEWLSQSETRASLHTARIVVANHITQFDGVFVRVPLGCRPAMLMRETYSQSGWLLLQLANMMFRPIWVPAPIGAPGTTREKQERERRASVRETMKSYLHRLDSPAPLVIFPEGSITNGAGLMRFARGAFEVSDTVQPIAIRLWCPLPLAQDTVDASLVQNYLRTLFQPWVSIELTVLAPLVRGPTCRVRIYTCRRKEAFRPSVVTCCYCNNIYGIP